MITEQTGDIWSVEFHNHWKVIPTNGSVNRLGQAVMGAGVALQAAKRFPKLPVVLGVDLKRSGLRTLLYVDSNLIIFPVKYHYRYKASLKLIDNSCRQLRDILIGGAMKVVMPRVGCGLGKLDWKVVRPVLEKWFGDISNEIVVLEYEE